VINDINDIVSVVKLEKVTRKVVENKLILLGKVGEKKKVLIVENTRVENKNKKNKVPIVENMNLRNKMVELHGK